MDQALTVATRNGDVTIATRADVSPGGNPLVAVALTLGFVTYPVQLSADQARALARQLLSAANGATLQADGFNRRTLTAGA
jgi:hypothetical protein